MQTRRRNLEETWQFLGEDMPRDANGLPFVPPHLPNYDDEELGFSFFRELVEGQDLSNLTLPHTYFGRSSLDSVNLQNTDLSRSRMCWNDFTNCDFRFADLSGCDMRASQYEDCDFTGASLRGADLRRSSFENYTFTGADLAGAIADTDETIEYLILDLTKEQQASMLWLADPGPEPPGG